MEVIKTRLEGCLILKNRVFKDDRGVFQETYNRQEFLNNTGLDINYLQDNLSISKKGVLRGLHFQREPFSQAKLIRVLKGEVLDVIVDLRKNSNTFGEHIKMKIKAGEGKSIFIPKGMAHGFLSLSDNAYFQYKCDAYYNPSAESGICYNDSELAIDWEYPDNELILSNKDKLLPELKSLQL